MIAISEIRGRISAIRQTRQITSAMRLIASSKMRKGLARYEVNERYRQSVRLQMKHLLAHSGGIGHPYLNRPHGLRTAFIVITGDRGLAGAYNENVLNLALEYIQRSERGYIFAVGRMAHDFFTKRNMVIDMEFLDVVHDPKLDHARLITSEVCNLFELDMLDEVYCIYTKLLSPTQQQPRALRLLPLLESDFDDVEAVIEHEHDMWFEPSPKAVFDTLVPQYLIGLVYAMLIQSYASEHSARMFAMDGATRNADGILAKLELDLHRARQASITQEIAEIVGGSL